MPKTMAQYPETESIASTGHFMFGILEVQVVETAKPEPAKLERMGDLTSYC